MNSGGNATVYEWHSIRRRTIFFGSLACLAVSAVCLFLIKDNEPDGKWMLRIFGIIFGLCGIGLLIPGKTTVDTSNRAVRRELLLFGKFVLFRRRLPFGGFRAVFIEFREDLSDHQWDNYYVGLRRISGRKFWIRYWNVGYGKPCPAAGELAKLLSHDLGLPIENPELLWGDKIVN